MKYSVIFALVVFVAGEPHAGQPVADIMSNTSGEQLDLLIAFTQHIYSAVIFNATQDPAPFQDFNYKLDGWFSEGDANITDALILGFSNYEKRITLNVEREEVGLYIKFPELTFVGNYSMNHTVGRCPSSPCTTHLGFGEFRHVFTGVTFDAQYKLDNSTDRTEIDPTADHITRYNPQFFKLNVTGCSLFAENYTVDDVLQTDWEQRSQHWLDYRIYAPGQPSYYDSRYGEASAYLLNTNSRAFFKTVQMIIDELINDLGAVLVP